MSVLTRLTSVVIDGDVIGHEPSGATKRVDGQGGTLLPGLIESYSHPRNLTQVQQLTSYGVTTAFLLACYDKQECSALKGLHGLADVHHASVAAAAPGSAHGNLTLSNKPEPQLLVHNTSDVKRWVQKQLELEPEFFKLITETPGLKQETLDVLVSEAHLHGRKVVCHAADYPSQKQAMLAAVDQIHHTPMDKPVDGDLALDVLERGQISVPTLVMMKWFVSEKPYLNYTAARETVRVYHETSVPILVGTDTNDLLSDKVAFGKSMHEEMELLVEAGMSPLEVLKSATSISAKHWGLKDRGVISPGKRADLVLVNGDPTSNIKATRNISKIWVAGEEYQDSLGKF
ncbi:hypothetical protein ACHAPT_001742 [Fusarium lateritium]